MTRIDPGRLDDLTEVLDEVRRWEGVEDRSGGTLYLRRKPFLHFHVGRDSRRADVRGSEGWVQVDLPEPAPASARRRLLTELRTAYAATATPPRPARPGARG